ncbi:g3778 [Coccomyxa viridis]|uniref:G3772 protein n=1 Tax=Coccomyxa viridis TaxID=1274662 RepID=A0ABP1FTY7_9CHLO
MRGDAELMRREPARDQQERIPAERRIQHPQSSSSSTRQELNAARLAGIVERQKDDGQISSLEAQVKEQGPQIAALEGCQALTKQPASEERRQMQMQQQIAALQQVLILHSCACGDVLLHESTALTGRTEQPEEDKSKLKPAAPASEQR